MTKCKCECVLVGVRRSDGLFQVKVVGVCVLAWLPSFTSAPEDSAGPLRVNSVCVCWCVAWCVWSCVCVCCGVCVCVCVCDSYLPLPHSIYCMRASVSQPNPT